MLPEPSWSGKDNAERNLGEKLSAKGRLILPAAIWRIHQSNISIVCTCDIFPYLAFGSSCFPPPGTPFFFSALPFNYLASYSIVGPGPSLSVALREENEPRLSWANVLVCRNILLDRLSVHTSQFCSVSEPQGRTQCLLSIFFLLKEVTKDTV